jgi:hypothetical protein
MAAELKELKDRYKGFAPEDLERLQKEKEARELSELERQQEYQAALKTKEERYAAEVQAVMQENQRLKQAIEDDRLMQAVIEAFVDSGGRKDQSPKSYVTMLMPVIRAQLKVEDGEVIVIDRNGEPRVNAEKGLIDFTLADLMEEQRKGAGGVFFEPKDQAKGAGATANGRRASLLQQQMAELEALPRSERISRARELGLG